MNLVCILYLRDLYPPSLTPFPILNLPGSPTGYAVVGEGALLWGVWSDHSNQPTDCIRHPPPHFLNKNNQQRRLAVRALTRHFPLQRVLAASCGCAGRLAQPSHCVILQFFSPLWPLIFLRVQLSEFIWLFLQQAVLVRGDVTPDLGTASQQTPEISKVLEWLPDTFKKVDEGGEQKSYSWILWY